MPKNTNAISADFWLWIEGPVTKLPTNTVVEAVKLVT